jgi:peptide deformylase
MVYKIVKYPDPVLEQRGEPVTDFGTPELRQFVEDMFETMYCSKGVGLAAPQVGVSQQITVIDVSGGEGDPQRIVLINPEITLREGKQTGEEGCLSIPGFRYDVTRAQKVLVRARNVAGEEIELEGQDLLARAMQHEIDHLHGILFLSHLSPLKRDLVKRRVKKLMKEGEWN